MNRHTVLDCVLDSVLDYALDCVLDCILDCVLDQWRIQDFPGDANSGSAATYYFVKFLPKTA